MQAEEAYSRIAPQLELRTYEEQSRELQDVLSRSLSSLRRIAFRYLSNVADAEDAVQDALLSAYKHLDQFKGEAQMSTWLGAIVINSARMHLRKRTRAIHLSLDEMFGDEQGYSASELLPDNAPTPEDECRQSELRARLRHFVEQLSPSLRTAYQLREFDGLTTSEAAQVLGVAEGTVKAQLARARAKLIRLMRKTFNARGRSQSFCPVSQKVQPI
jgi:RNA polymerase sigma-70 factor, ECF subfamily